MLKRPILPAVLLAALLAGSMNLATFAQSSKSMHNTSATASLSQLDRTFMTHVAQDNLAEISAGNLAVKRTRNPQVKNVAQTLVTDHTAANTDLTTLGGQLNVSLPKQTSKMNQMHYNHLTRLSDGRFDRTFIAGQDKDHHKAISLFKKEISQGHNTSVKNYASTYLPKIQHHTDMLDQVEASLKTNKTK